MKMKYSHTVALMACLAHGMSVAQDSGGLQMECLLEPFQVSDIGTPVPGVLSSVDVRRGDVVRKGQPVAYIDSRLEQAAVKLAETRAAFSKRRVSRSAALYADDLLTEQEKDELETESLLAEIELSQALTQVEIRTIRSPVDGVVVARNLDPGEFILDAEILTVAQVDPINVEVIAPVAYFGQIDVGMKATVRPEAPVTRAYQGVVTVVDRVIDAASGTFGVRLEIANKNLELPAGLRCMVEFDR